MRLQPIAGLHSGREVACGDFSFASLKDRLPKLKPQSGAGLWLDPFKGIPTTDVSLHWI